MFEQIRMIILSSVASLQAPYPVLDAALGHNNFLILPNPQI